MPCLSTSDILLIILAELFAELTNFWLCESRED